MTQPDTLSETFIQEIIDAVKQIHQVLTDKEYREFKRVLKENSYVSNAGATLWMFYQRRADKLAPIALRKRALRMPASDFAAWVVQQSDDVIRVEQARKRWSVLTNCVWYPGNMSYITANELLRERMQQCVELP